MWAKISAEAKGGKPGCPSAYVLFQSTPFSSKNVKSIPHYLLNRLRSLARFFSSDEEHGEMNASILDSNLA